MARPQRRAHTGFLGFLLAGAMAFACSSSDKNDKNATGAKCTTSQDCAGLPCVSGVCQSSDGSPAGSQCTQASDCQSGICTGGLCLPPPGSLPNTTCTTGPDCASGVCVSGQCQIPAGASGSVDLTDCAAGSLACTCQPGDKCKPGLTCISGLCCSSKTMSCSTGSAPTDAGSSGGTPTACTPGVVGPVITECGYPYASANPLTDILFNESTVLAAIVPSGGYPFARIQLFYNDEHAMTLGVHDVIINGVTTTYPVTPLTTSPEVADAPLTGTNLIVGQQAGVDPVGRPMWPALFITDITSDANAVSGDWQWGGAAVNPTNIAGTWKGAVRTVDSTGASITPDADPARNDQNYGNGDTAPAGSIIKPEAFGTEVRWDIRLEAGHNYRFQVMVHDGDQNKVGGDSGEACVTFCAGNACPAGLSSCTTDTNCTNGDVCASGCCVPPPPPPAVDSGTPTPTNGQCPLGWVFTIQNGQQICTEFFQ